VEARARMDEQARRTLEALCGPGDLLGASVRRAIVKEAFAARGRCAACLELRGACLRKGANFFSVCQNRSHTYKSESELGALAPMVHALANLQTKLSTEWYQQALELVKVTEGVGPPSPSHADARSTLTEIICVVALSVGITAFNAVLGKPVPDLPPSNGKDEAHFSKASEFLNPNALATDANFSWTQVVCKAGMKWDVLRARGFNVPEAGSLWERDGPISELSTNPCGLRDFVAFSTVMFMDLSEVLNFSSTLPKHRNLRREDLELVASEYAAGVACAF